jgi:hypothetical protein
MRIVSIIARYLLVLLFTVSGLNGFLNFIHQPPPTNPLALQFFGSTIGDFGRSIRTEQDGNQDS